jgi:hypothetical protein
MVTAFLPNLSREAPGKHRPGPQIMPLRPVRPAFGVRRTDVERPRCGEMDAAAARQAFWRSVAGIRPLLLDTSGVVTTCSRHERAHTFAHPCDRGHIWRDTVFMV